MKKFLCLFAVLSFSTALFVSCTQKGSSPHDDYEPVTNITGIPTTAVAGVPLTLSGTVEPSHATNTTITWQVVNQNDTGAEVDGDILTTTDAGTVNMKAVVVNGKTATTNYEQPFSIIVEAGSSGIVGDFVGTLLNDPQVQALPDVSIITHNPVGDYYHWTPGWIPYEVLDRLYLWGWDDVIFWPTMRFGKPGIVIAGRPPRTEVHHRRVRLPQSAVEDGYMVGDVVTFSAVLDFEGFGSDMQFAPVLAQFGHTTYPHGTHWFDFTVLAEEKYEWNKVDDKYLIDFSVTLNANTVAQLNTPDAGLQFMFYCTENPNHYVRTLPLTVHEFSVYRDVVTASNVARNPIPAPVQQTAPGTIFDLRTNPIIQGLTVGTEIDPDTPKILANAGILPISSTAIAERPADNDGDVALRVAHYKKDIDGKRYTGMRFNERSIRVLTDFFPDITPFSTDTPIIFYDQQGERIYRNQTTKMKIGDIYSAKGKLLGLPAEFTPFEVVLCTAPAYGWNLNMNLVLDRIMINPGDSGEFELSGILDENIREIGEEQRGLLSHTGVPHGSVGIYADTIFYRLALQFDGGVHIRINGSPADEWSPLRGQVDILVTDFTVVRP